MDFAYRNFAVLFLVTIAKHSPYLGALKFALFLIPFPLSFVGQYPVLLGVFVQLLCLFLFQTKYEEAKKAIAAKGKPLQQKVSLPSTRHLPRGLRFSRVLAYSLALMKLRDYS